STYTFGKVVAQDTGSADLDEIATRFDHASGILPAHDLASRTQTYVPAGQIGEITQEGPPTELLLVRFLSHIPKRQVEIIDILPPHDLARKLQHLGKPHTKTLRRQTQPDLEIRTTSRANSFD